LHCSKERLALETMNLDLNVKKLLE